MANLPRSLVTHVFLDSEICPKKGFNISSQVTPAWALRQDDIVLSIKKVYHRGDYIFMCFDTVVVTIGITCKILILDINHFTSLSIKIYL
jgi:hypothetical protein